MASEEWNGFGGTIDRPALILRSDHPGDSPKDPDPDQEGFLPGSECVLLVEDEETVRDVAEFVLKRCGYKVLLAEDGERALDLFRERKGEISLVVLDLIMPGMGGKRCLEEMLALDPETKIVVASGYVEDGPPKSILDAGAKEFVKKPYDVRLLTGIVRKVLNEDHIP